MATSLIPIATSINLMATVAILEVTEHMWRVDVRSFDWRFSFDHDIVNPFRLANNIRDVSARVKLALVQMAEAELRELDHVTWH